jgi:hypothetical protein
MIFLSMSFFIFKVFIKNDSLDCQGASVSKRQAFPQL